MPRPKQKFMWIAMLANGPEPRVLHTAPYVETTRAEACANARTQRAMFVEHAPPGSTIVVDVYVDGNPQPIYSARRTKPEPRAGSTRGMIASTGHTSTRVDDTRDAEADPAHVDAIVDAVLERGVTDDALPDAVDAALANSGEIEDITAQVGARVVGRLSSRQCAINRAVRRGADSSNDNTR